MPRFVLLYHDCPAGYERPYHWDFMLESGAKLRTWALAQLPYDWQAAHVKTIARFGNCPSLAAANSVPAERLADHRPNYLEFEGPLSNNRGSVVRVASGNYESKEESPQHWQIALSGDSLTNSTVSLQSSGSDGTAWCLTVVNIP